MIDYSDASDLFYVWVKRALSSTHPELLSRPTLWPAGQRRRDHRQEEVETPVRGDHRTQEHYDRVMARGAQEERSACRAARWRRHDRIRPRRPGRMASSAQMPSPRRPVPDRIVASETEKGGQAGIVEHPDDADHVLPPDRAGRPSGGSTVDRGNRRVSGNASRCGRAAGLALTDQLMASAGPAMEVVGRYCEVVDTWASRLTPYYYLLSRHAPSRKPPPSALTTCPGDIRR